MSKKRMLADVFWQAANEHLSPVYDFCAVHSSAFSCVAVGWATLGENAGAKHATRSFLTALGCDGHVLQLSRLCGHQNCTAALQGVRYMWLLLAMHVAEDEEITV